jgi:SAM-dependent methyltransferase
VFIANNILPEELGVAYSSLDTKKYYMETEDASAPKVRGSVADLSKILPTSAKLIDVGGGDGAFLRELHRQGFSNLFLHEIPGDTSEGLDFVKQDFRDMDYKSIPSAEFDCATLMDVMEHVPDPNYTLSQIHRVLRKGGRIYFHTPCVTKTDRLFHSFRKFPFLRGVARSWQIGRTSVFHLQNYTPMGFEIILSRAGFEIESIKITNELSWSVARYIKVYLLRKLGLPDWLAPLLVPFFWPLLATRLNANKGIVVAKRL